MYTEKIYFVKLIKYPDYFNRAGFLYCFKSVVPVLFGKILACLYRNYKATLPYYCVESLDKKKHNHFLA